MNKRIIPVLLLKDNVLYKTEKFKKPKYNGDPIAILSNQFLGLSFHPELNDIIIFHQMLFDSKSKLYYKKFNQKYSDDLLEEQKALLTLYISSFTDNSLELKVYLNKGLNKVICTDIDKDGMLSGPSIELYKKIYYNIFNKVI